MTKQSTAEALTSCLISPNVSDSNYEAANIVDAVDSLSRGAFAIARAIKYPEHLAKDETGADVNSLMDAVTGITSGLLRIADAINNLADAVRDSKS